MAAADDYYGVLMVGRDAGPAQIRAAFRELIARWHPDRSTAADANARSAAIIEAYRTLSRPDRRRAYDDRRRSAHHAMVGPDRRKADRRRAGARGEAGAQQTTRGRSLRTPSVRTLSAIWAGVTAAIVLATAGPVIQPADELPDGFHRELAGG